MAKIIISTNDNQVNQFKDENIKIGFDKFKFVENPNYSLSIHQKKIHQVKNFYQFDNDDFCSIIGTCIVDGKTGIEAIKKLYDIFDSEIEKLRSKLLGNYIICIKKYNKIYIFTDKYQVLKSYYHTHNEEWVFSNSIESIAKTTTNVDVNEFGLIEESLLVGSFGKETMFKNIYRLFGYEYIEIDCLSNTFTIKNISCKRRKRDFSKKTIEEAAQEYAEIIKDKFKPVADLYGDSIRMHQTGGLDNRTTLAAFLSLNIIPDILYGVGNSMLTNTKTEDLEICKLYEEKYQMNLHVMNWNETYSDKERNWFELFQKYGFSYTIYGGSKNYFAEYEGKIPNYPRFMDNGYFLENLRLREFIANRSKKTMSIEEFVEEYLLGGSGYGIVDSTLISNYDKFKDKLINDISLQMDIYGIEPRGIITEENFDEVRWIHARHTDSKSVNLLNEFTSSIAMFSLEELHEFPFDLPAKWRKDGKFQLMVINSLKNDILDIPIFSHCKKHTLDRDTFNLKSKVNYTQRISRFLKNIGISKTNHKIISSMYRTIFPLKKSSLQDQELNKLKILIDENINIFSEKYKLSLSLDNNQNSILYLMRLAQYLYGIDQCLKDKS